MTEKRVDKVTGTETVGHEWDGIEELDTPMPRWWLICWVISIVWAIGYVILYPAWPMVERATEGTLGWSSRGEFAAEMKLAEEGRADFRALLAATPLADLPLPENEPLLQQAVAGGRAAFDVNCIQCHGSGAAGSKGYPNLNDDDWLWGGDINTIHYTIANGIREPGHEGTRNSIMPPFEGAFDSAQMDALIGHVISLREGSASSPIGAQLYADNCAACHGADGTGDRTQGAPNLADAVWLYGASEEEIRTQIVEPRLGMMPRWEHRLDAATVKMLAAFVYSRGGGEALATPAETEAAVDGDTVESETTQSEDTGVLITEGEGAEA